MRRASLRKFAIVVMLFATAIVAHTKAYATIIVPGQIKITSAQLTPTKLNIPTLLPGCLPVPFVDDCGFTSNTTFLLQVGIRNLNSTFGLTVNSLGFTIFEDDLIFDDSVGTFVKISSLPTNLAPGGGAVIAATGTVSASTLNAQCATGCTNAIGFAAELGALEFFSRGTLNYFFAPRPDLLLSVDFRTPIPEPATLSIFVMGLGWLGFIAWRRRRHA